MAGSKSVVHVGMVAGESEKAWLLGISSLKLYGAALYADGDIRWVPKAVMSWPDDMEVGDEDVDVEIEDWFCVKEGIDTT